ncbi:hypothetical protein HK104_005905 [Borealophlyctis nickersoniae]|nr:hypothetical protein HK104_005905 [Borealophlyctis nickersoniae]
MSEYDKIVADRDAKYGRIVDHESPSILDNPSLPVPETTPTDVTSMSDGDIRGGRIIEVSDVPLYATDTSTAPSSVEPAAIVDEQAAHGRIIDTTAPSTTTGATSYISSAKSTAAAITSQAQPYLATARSTAAGVASQAQPYIDSARSTAAPYIDSARSTAAPYIDSARSTAAPVLESVRSTASGIATEAQHTAEPIVNTVRSTAVAARDAAAPYVHAAAETATHAAAVASETINKVVHAPPVVNALGSAKQVAGQAYGAIAGAAAPIVNSSVVQQAAAAAGPVVREVKMAADAAVHTVSDLVSPGHAQQQAPVAAQSDLQAH